MSLEDIRLQVNAIDARIVGLLAQRAWLVRDAVRYGAEQIEARERQEQIIQHVRYMAEHQGLPPNMAERIFRTILTEMVALEKREAGL
jgi:chorismate mutase